MDHDRRTYGKCIVSTAHHLARVNPYQPSMSPYINGLMPKFALTIAEADRRLAVS